MRKFIYLFMFLFACTSYAQTEQISGQFRLIGTQEQPEAEKVLTIDDNGDVGYMNSNRPSFARFGSQMTGLGSATSGIPVAVTADLDVIFEENISYEIVASGVGNNIKILEAGYYEISAGFSTNYYSQVEYYVDIFIPSQGGIYNSDRVSNGSAKFTGGVSATTGMVYIPEDGLVSMKVDIRGREDVTAGVFLTIQKIK